MLVKSCELHAYFEHYDIYILFIIAFYIIENFCVNNELDFYLNLKRKKIKKCWHITVRYLISGKNIKSIKIKIDYFQEVLLLVCLIVNFQSNVEHEPTLCMHGISIVKTVNICILYVLFLSWQVCSANKEHEVSSENAMQFSTFLCLMLSHWTL